MRRRQLSLAALTALVIAMFCVAAGCGTSVLIPVLLPPLSSVTISPDTDTLLVGQQGQFTAVARDTDTVVVSGATFGWSSSDPSVFTVSHSGRVTGVGEGVAQLFAAAGGISDSATVVVFFQAGWYTQPSGTTNDLNGVFVQPNGRDGCAVGDAGTIVVTDDAGQGWFAQPSNTAFNLNDVWFTTAETGFAVGHGGTVLRTRNGGRSWARLATVPAGENLFGVCFADTSLGWVVGSNGVVLRTTDGGATWSRQSPTSQQLNSVSFSGPLDGWAVGEGGVIVGTHDGGASWYVVQPSVTSQPLRAVWRSSMTRAWAGGAQGAQPFTTATPDSLQWSLGSFGATNSIHGVQLPDGVTGYAVGTNGQGLVLKTADGGASWQPQVANSSQALLDVWFVDARRGWAVGAAGRILHTATGGE
jgi:photosystem II stability/assembly factor-like uncharacterized protein